MTFEVLLPLPSRGVSPNARLHWADKHRAVKAARRVAWYWFRRVLPLDWQQQPVTLDVIYRCPGRSEGYRPRDIQNAIGALKPMVDGMVDANVVPDDSAEWVQWGRVSISKVGLPGILVTVRT